MRTNHDHSHYRTYAGILGAAAGIAVLGGLFAAAVAGAVSAVAPSNAGEPSITGTPTVGQILRSSAGTWNGTTPMTFAFRWLRCDASGSKPDGSDCVPISSATARAYEVRRADVGFRLRVRVTATNADGSMSAASNPTDVVTPAKPVNVDRPSISGTAAVGNRLQANRGRWTGVAPITYSFRWLRCDSQGANCAEISGATDTDYVVTNPDAGRTLRVRVTARNDRGSTTALSPQTAVVSGTPSPPSGGSISVSDVPRGERLVVSEVRFSPNPVTSPDTTITVRVRVKDTRGDVVRGALVFVRSTPRVTSSGDRQATDQNGWIEYRLIPNRYFVMRHDGNVQFFVKAYRAGDPPLAGIAGYRLVQVHMA